MEYRSYTLGELESHLGPMFSGREDLVPISPPRLSSYLKNPRSRPGDKVLFECVQQGRLIGFRTLLPDHFIDSGGQEQRMAWLSGNYVAADYRRKGISTRLLELAEESWEGRLLYTNFAPVSRSLYDRSGRFPLFLERPGRRFYLRASLEDLLGERWNAGPLLRMTDRAINKLRERYLHKSLVPRSTGYTVRRTGLEDPELRRQIDRSMGSSLFNRDARMMKWILEYPWLTEEPEEAVNYPFSHLTTRFRNQIFQFRTADEAPAGWMWLLFHGPKVTVPYLHCENPLLMKEMVWGLLQAMVAEGSAYLTVRYPEAEEGLKEFRQLFMADRNMPQLIFAHRKILPMLPSGKQVFDGDGDVAFTG